MSEPKLEQFSPVWLVDDIAQACAYYENKLGFTVHVMMGEPAHYAILSRDSVTVSFNKPQQEGARNSVAPFGLGSNFADAYISVSEIQRFYDNLKATEGVEIEDDLKRYGYGMVDFVITDPNGYKLCFGQATEDVPGADQLEEGMR